ncbi:MULTISPECIES: DUF6233 domain-containing protein [Streptomyces]|uniref:DUF6233 domain-containing protein n=1 Tax=Streptomyces TaxID=1883 RepID=UPI0035B0FA59
MVPAPERRGKTVVDDANCIRAGSGGKEIGTMDALDALMRGGARACADCDAAAALMPALELGEDSRPRPTLTRPCSARPCIWVARSFTPRQSVRLDRRHSLVPLGPAGRPT